MEIANESLEWDDEDRAVWKAFLNTRTGRRLVPKAAEEIPALLASGEANAILIRNGEVIGFQKAFKSFLSLTQAPPAPPASTPEDLPSLTDDTRWDDGEKLS